MTFDKLDVEKMTSVPRSAFSGIAMKNVITPIVNAINALIDWVNGNSDNELSEQQEIDALSARIGTLELPAADVIADLSEGGVNVSLLNLASIQALNNQSADQAKTINKILAVMRTRKEIKS